MFVGCEPASKAYRIRVGNKVKVSKNVKFFEIGNSQFTKEKSGIHTPSTETQLPLNLPHDDNINEIPENANDDDWDFVPVELTDAVEMTRDAGRGTNQHLPTNLKVMRSLTEVLRDQALAEESGVRDRQVQETSEEELMSNGPPQLGSQSDQDQHEQSDEDEDERHGEVRGGTNRYGLSRKLSQTSRFQALIMCMTLLLHMQVECHTPPKMKPMRSHGFKRREHSYSLVRSKTVTTVGILVRSHE